MNNLTLFTAEKTAIFQPEIICEGSKEGGAKMILKTNHNEYIVTVRDDGLTIFGGILKNELPCRKLAPFSIGHSAHFEVIENGNKYAMHTSPLVSISQ